MKDHTIQLLMDGWAGPVRDVSEADLGAAALLVSIISGDDVNTGIPEVDAGMAEALPHVEALRRMAMEFKVQYETRVARGRLGDHLA